MAKKQETNNTTKLWVKILCGIMGFLMVFGVLVMLISSLQSAALESDDTTVIVSDQMISVGLYCNDNAVQSYAIGSDDGVQITDANAALSIQLNSSRIIAAVDDHLYRRGDTLSTENGGIATVGGYHIQISYFTFADLGIDTDHDNPVFIRPGSSAGSTDGYLPSNVYEYIGLLEDDSSFKAFGLFAFPYYVSAQKCYIRVGSFFTKEEAEAALVQLNRVMTVNAEVVSPESQTITVLSEDYTVLCELSGASGAYRIHPLGSGHLQDASGKTYAGSISISRPKNADRNGISIINYVMLEDYVAALIPSEVSSEWDEVLLKTMAVVLRTELVRKIGHHATDGFDICADNHCHSYVGGAVASDRVVNAVKETEGQILTYQDRPIHTPYALNNGSSTVSAMDAFGSDIPYLQSVYTPWESVTEWTVEFTPYELYQLLYNEGYTEIAGNIKSVTVNSRAKSSDYVTSITFTDLFGTSVTVEGCEAIRLLFAGKLPSACFVAGLAGESVSRTKRVLTGEGTDYTDSEESVTLSGTYGSFVFLGSGSGCGVGLSIEGARSLAKLGYSYEKILEIYFPGATLTSKR